VLRCHLSVLVLGVLLAVDAVVSHLKTMSRKVTTPEEIAQVLSAEFILVTV